MKPLVFLLLLTLLPTARGQENRYDLLSKTITPFLAVFAKERKSDNRAFTLKFRIEQSTDLPEELRGAVAELSVESPDKLRIHGPLLGSAFTLVRNGDKIWISPGLTARALLDAADGKLPPPDKKFKMGDFRLPFPEKQMNLLTALLSVKDVGIDPIEGSDCRVLDISLMPELASSLDVQGWVGRLWVLPDHKPARFTLARKGWNVVLRIDDVQFAEHLPESSWTPSSAEAGDVLELKPSQYSRFLRAIGGAKAER